MVSMSTSYCMNDDNERNLSRKAYDIILQMIINRELPVNTVLQERRLAEMMDISRTPVRNALNRLENEGFIVRNGGRTPVVKEFSIQELIETLHVRRTLEGEAARLAAGRIPGDELDAIARQIKRLLSQDRPDPKEDWAVDTRLHDAIAHYSGNRLLKGYIQTLRLKTSMFNLRQVPERFVIGHNEHLAIIEALRNGQAEQARDLLIAHIDNVRESIIKRLSQF
ncbi:GntR family transcriptional regulator [Gibbsiella quercinecans]|uniref:GntR family transcriptional regulator n=3 Tax=Gibbsiella TaxID=929812 RepID=A0A250AYS8_9GAMM|nr:GntR family transcriptional regulator [Gibbsiella quercinecans]RLM02786.1 GntR family transcriptional regulator [Gibbsiella quercinecans]RLM05914.1 GntR family transcriptional regulator [Gibbsiella quercinecans]RLM07758.1 GntR family transcriptional regulator [Gibbsiella quercinecans]